MLRSVDQLTAELQLLGVAQGDLVMVHASMRRVGPVVGGAAGVVQALEAAVGRSGSLVMNLGARDDWDWVNDRPAASRAELLAAAPAFDPERTPADPDHGVLAEVFRTAPGTRVNDHPDGRFGVRGPLADDLLDDGPWDDYYGPGSLLARFVDGGGRVLRLGADLGTVTLIHLAEYLADVPAKRRVTRHHKVLPVSDGDEVRAVSCLDDSHGIAEWPGEDYFDVLLTAYLATGRARTGRVGEAPGELIESADLLDFATRWLTRNLGSQ